MRRRIHYIKASPNLPSNGSGRRGEGFSEMNGIPAPELPAEPELTKEIEGLVRQTSLPALLIVLDGIDDARGIVAVAVGLLAE